MYRYVPSFPISRPALKDIYMILRFIISDVAFQQTASRDIQGRIVLCRSTLVAPSWLLILEWCLLSKSVTSKPLSETVSLMFLSVHPHCLGLHWAYHADDGAHLVDATQDHPLLRVRSAIQLKSSYHFCTVPRYHEMSSKHGLSNISYCFFICFGSLMQQGSTTVPAADSGWGTNYPEINCVLGLLLSWLHCNWRSLLQTGPHGLLVVVCHRDSDNLLWQPGRLPHLPHHRVPHLRPQHPCPEGQQSWCWSSITLVVLSGGERRGHLGSPWRLRHRELLWGRGGRKVQVLHKCTHPNSRWSSSCQIVDDCQCIVNTRHIAEQAVKHSEADTVPSGWAERFLRTLRSLVT